MSWECVSVFPIDWPSADWVSDLVQLLEFDCTAQAQREADVRCQSYRYRLQSDAQFGHSRQAFRQLRGPPEAPLTSVKEVVTQPAVVAARPCHGEVCLTVPQPAAFKPGREVQFGGISGLVVATGCDHVDVAFSDPVPDAAGPLEQTSYLTLASELHAGFRDGLARRPTSVVRPPGHRPLWMGSG